MHLWLSLPTAIEKGSARFLQQDKEVVETDGGYEVRNTRWSGPLRSWQIGYNNKPLSDVNHAAVEQMWRNTAGGADTFNFYDERSDETARVRFDGELQLINTTMQIYRIDTFTLKEVRDVSPEPTVSPAISGTTTSGSTLTCSDGTWSGSPTSIDKQWTRDGVEIAGATNDTYLLVSGDHGHLIGCTIVATDAYGGQTMTFAAEVGPIT